MSSATTSSLLTDHELLAGLADALATARDFAARLAVARPDQPWGEVAQLFGRLQVHTQTIASEGVGGGATTGLVA